KGRLVGIQGRIQTGSYTNKNGDKVYTTDVVADRVEFLEWGDKDGAAMGGRPQQNQGYAPQNQGFAPNQGYNQVQEQPQQPATPVGIPQGFEAIEDDDIPF
ncbi:MAG: single-stranded DNA-binding protein, partial [Anaerovoracaceae bacterium]